MRSIADCVRGGNMASMFGTHGGFGSSNGMVFAVTFGIVAGSDCLSSSSSDRSSSGSLC